MKLGKYFLSSRLVIVLLIVLFFAVSLILRVALPHDQIFTSVGIKFSSNDAYYHMRIVDSMVNNFPHTTQFDPYYLYPSGGALNSRFFDWLLAGVIMIAGLGSPTAHTVDVIGVLFPAILAALIIIPVYFIGKVLFNRWAGVLAAGLVAVLPGEFLGRSILGFTDNHVAETLFSTIAMLFLILAIKSARQKQLTFRHLIRHDWKTILKPLIYSLLAGVFLGIYLITWLGAPLFIFIITLYFIIQFIIDHLKHKSTEHLGIVGFVSFLIALIIFFPLSAYRDMTVAMVIAMLIPPALAGISALISSRGLKSVYYPMILIGSTAVFIIIFHAAAPNYFNAMIDKFNAVFMPSGSTAATTQEMQHFLSPQGSFSTAIAWGNFTTSFFLVPGWPIPGFAFISLIALVYLFIKKHSDKEVWLLLFIWTLVILVATLIQRRFSYYLVVNIALLSAYISWQVIWLSGLRKLIPAPDEITEQAGASAAASKAQEEQEIKPGITSFQIKKASAATAASKKSKKQQNKQQNIHETKPGITIYHINTALAVIVVLVLVFSFNIAKSRVVASQAPYSPSDAWQASLLWMKDNTPEPLGDPDAYYKLYTRGTFNYPDSAYGVTAWWDYGYWISRIAHRIPNTNPSQDPAPIQKTAKLFLSSDESTAQKIRAELNSSYIIGDYDSATMRLTYNTSTGQISESGKFWAVLNWAGLNSADYYDVFLVPYKDNQLVPKMLFYPKYYDTLLVRLYNFDGKAVTKESPIVVAYDDIVDQGNHYKVVTDSKQFSSYNEALDYIKNQKTGKYVVVSGDPFTSPVALEAVQDYQLVYSSKPDNSSISEVKIFQYLNSK